APAHTTREAWLAEAVDALKPVFEAAGATVPAVRVSVGWPGGKGRAQMNRVIGQCWSSASSADKVPQVFISPTLDDPGVILATLAHELVHAVDDCKSGHKAGFARLARGIGLTGKMTATVAGDGLKATLAEVAAFLGPYPHARLTAGAGTKGEKSQTCRQLKVECPKSGYIARTTKRWLDEAGAPICPCHREPMIPA
ncbi:SprT-like domain-containing protein, partial [Micromonospora sp. KC213]|uniref:SprT-like domain-containing protein n=1 Tax=Micromonospora sp. KC213 TaxID=2530378 RepID=UPI00104A11D1